MAHTYTHAVKETLIDPVVHPSVLSFDQNTWDASAVAIWNVTLRMRDAAKAKFPVYKLDQLEKIAVLERNLRVVYNSFLFEECTSLFWMDRFGILYCRNVTIAFMLRNVLLRSISILRISTIKKISIITRGWAKKKMLLIFNWIKWSIIDM